MAGTGGDGAGSSLAGLRAVSRLTQEELADRSGITVRAIRKLEAGRIARPRMHTLLALARGLGLDDTAQAVFVAQHRGGPEEVHASRDHATVERPLQLPSRPAALHGRDEELSRLLAVLTPPGNRPPALVTGLGGIGKSALTTEACTRAGVHYPGGQLYAQLSRPDGSARAAVDLLGEFLCSVGVPARRIPATLSERAALWRTTVADAPVLLLLDDAATEDQVRPLLPSGEGTAVITSRVALGGLDVSLRLRLAPVDRHASAAILTDAVPRADLEAGNSLDRLVTACGGIPLALRLLAARLAMSPHVAPSRVASQIEAGHDRLDGLSSGDRSVSSSIDGSFQAASATARRVLMISDLAVRSFEDWHVACVAELSIQHASLMTSELVAAGLIEVATSRRAWPRYQLHDLVRAHVRNATDRSSVHALERLAAWFVHLTVASGSTAIPRSVPHVLWPPRPSALTPEMVQQILTEGGPWFDDEWQNLIDVAEQALELGRPRTAGAILAAIRQPMSRSGRLRELITLADRCAGASHGDPLARACALVVAGSARSDLGEYRRAGELLDEAWPDLEGADTCTLAGAWYETGWINHRLGDAAASRVAYERSIELHQSIGDEFGELGCRVGLVELRSRSGAPLPGVTEHARIARTLVQAFDDYRTRAKVDISLCRAGEPGLTSLRHHANTALSRHDLQLAADCFSAISIVERRTGRAAAAAAAAKDAAEISRSLERPADLALALTELGRALDDGGYAEDALASWREALALRITLGHGTDVHELRGMITAMRHATEPEDAATA